MSIKCIFRIQIICRRCFCSSESKSLRKAHRVFGAPSSSQLSLQSYMKSASSPSLLSENISFHKSLYKSLYKSYNKLSLFSKLFSCSIIFLIIFGDYLDRKYIEYDEPNGIYSFLSDSPEETIMFQCRTGDIIVFQRPILSFNPLNIIRASFRQFACNGPYDHCGIIINNGNDDDLPYILEIDQNYYNKLRITSFDQRILTARERAIFIRHIHKTVINKEICDKFSDWIDFKVNGYDDNHKQNNIDEIEEFINNTYHQRDSLYSILMTLCFNGDNTVKIRSSIRDLTRKIRQNEYEIATQIDNKREYGANGGMKTISILNKRHGRVKTIDDLIKETRILKLERVLKKNNLKKRIKYIRKSRKINSSQFIGYLWRYLGILSNDGAKPWEMRPQQFADSKIEIPMIGTSRLGHVQFIKTINETKKINDSQLRMRYRSTTTTSNI